MDYRKMRRIGQYYRTHNKPSPFHNIDELIGRFDINERIASSIANKQLADAAALNTNMATNETFGQMISSMIENENKSLAMINKLNDQVKLTTFKFDNMSNILFHTPPPDQSTWPADYTPNFNYTTAPPIYTQTYTSCNQHTPNSIPYYIQL